MSDPRPARKHAAGTDGATLDRLPPHSVEAEAGLLGCCLLSPTEVMDALAEKKAAAEWFYDQRHRAIFEAIKGFHDEQKPCDMILLAERLKTVGMLEQVGGIGYVMGLPNTTPSAANLPYYAEIVREKWQLRKLLKACAETQAKVYEHEGDVNALLSEVQTSFIEVTEPDSAVKTEVNGRQLAQESLDELGMHYHRGKTQLRGLPTGLDYLDKMLLGIQKEDYVVLAGRPGDGKTAMALNIVQKLTQDYPWFTEGPGHTEETPNWIRHENVPVGVFSLEMSRKSLGKRLIFSGSRVSMESYNTGFMSALDFSRMEAAAKGLAASPIILDAEPGQTISQIASKARRWVRQYGIKLFVLDYLQLVLPDKRFGRIDRVQELTDISAMFVKLKKQLGVPWLILAQMNRNIEQAECKRVPVLSDLRDCGAIEQDCDTAMFLYKPSFKDIEGDEATIDAKHVGSESTKPRRVNVFVAKQRDGPTGKAELLFLKNNSLFEDWRKWQLEHGVVPAGKGERVKPKEEVQDEMPVD